MAKHFKPKKTLFFIAGSTATEAEIEEALKLEPGVQFRNASLTRPDEAIEAFDRVAGLVPARYQAAADAKAGKVAPEAGNAPDGASAAAGEGGSTAPVLPVRPPVANSGAGWSRNT